MRTAALLAAALLVSAPAPAVDLTGTWEGGFKCSAFDGETFKFVEDGEILEISQDGTALDVEWVDVANVQGLALGDAKKPESKGMATLVDCETNTDLTSGYAELAVLKVKIDREKGKGALKGQSFYTADGDVIGVCKWKFTLVSTVDPGAGGC